jgi:site-specific DNA recombinase
MYAASQEFFRMEKTRLVAARYVRNSDPSKKDSEVQQAQLDALSLEGRTDIYEMPDDLIYRDAISSLKHPYWEREALMRAFDDAERSMFAVILVTEFARIARTSAEQAAIIQYFKRYNVELISITEKFEDTPEGRLLFNIQGYLDEVEAQKVRIRTSRGKAHRAKRALTGQGRPMYGYLYADGQEYTRERYILNTAVIHVDYNGTAWTESLVIDFCCDLCLSGMSLYNIALTLTKLGIPTQRGKEHWDPCTVRNYLTNICYTGEGYNGRYTDDPVRVPEGLYPKIISREKFERVQRQLTLNSEMSPRNNKHPKVGLLRGLIYCGVCGQKLWIHHTNKAKKLGHKIRGPVYQHYRNHGIDTVIHHHVVTIGQEKIDREAWEFAIPFIQDAGRMRLHIETMRSQVDTRDHSQDLKAEINKLNMSIRSLFNLAETSDPTDTENTEALQARLSHLQREKRCKEKLLQQVTSAEDKQAKILEALDRFEEWARSQRQFLNNPNYEVSYDDKRNALLVLGVKVTVWPALPGYEKRSEIRLLPPDIARVVDCVDDFTR